VEFQGFAELGFVVGGAVEFGLVRRALVGDQGLQGFFGDGAVACGSRVVLRERASLAAGDVGGGDGWGVGVVGGEDQGDGFVRGGGGLDVILGFQHQEDEVVDGGGAGVELGLWGKAVGHVEGLAADAEGGGVVGAGEILAAGVEGLEEGVDLLVGVGWELVEVEVDGGGDDGGRGTTGFRVEDGLVGGLGVGVDGGLAKRDGTAEGADGGDVAGSVDRDLEVDRALDASLFGFRRIDDGGDGEGFVLNRRGLEGDDRGRHRLRGTWACALRREEESEGEDQVHGDSDTDRIRDACAKFGKEREPLAQPAVAAVTWAHPGVLGFAGCRCWLGLKDFRWRSGLL
jgi:hypothetical protein